MQSDDAADDPRFHYEIWTGPKAEFGDQEKSIYYVENHNAACGYAELATDFRMAAQVMIETYRASQLGNWMAPTAHLVRQTLELELKSLLSSVIQHDVAVDVRILSRHDLRKLWCCARDWLSAHGYKVLLDGRLAATEGLLSAFHEIDPSGDLFRFAISRKTAFRKKKSYDRVGLNLDLLSEEFEAAGGLLGHWDAVLFRAIMKKEMGWETDPYFDADNFPQSTG